MIITIGKEQELELTIDQGTFTIRNKSDQPINIGAFKEEPIRFPSKKYDTFKQNQMNEAAEGLLIALKLYFEKEINESVLKDAALKYQNAYNS